MIYSPAASPHPEGIPTDARPINPVNSPDRDIISGSRHQLKLQFTPLISPNFSGRSVGFHKANLFPDLWVEGFKRAGNGRRTSRAEFVRTCAPGSQHNLIEMRHLLSLYGIVDPSHILSWLQNSLYMDICRGCLCVVGT